MSRRRLPSGTGNLHFMNLEWKQISMNSMNIKEDFMIKMIHKSIYSDIVIFIFSWSKELKILAQ